MIDRRTFLLALAGEAIWFLSETSATAQTNDNKLFVDDYGLIVQRDKDGGDTAQREGWAWFGTWIRLNVLNQPWPVKRDLSFAQVLSLLEVDESGNFRRNPAP